jgi:hypothetical protein
MYYMLNYYGSNYDNSHNNAWNVLTSHKCGMFEIDCIATANPSPLHAAGASNISSCSTHDGPFAELCQNFTRMIEGFNTCAP